MSENGSNDRPVDRRVKRTRKLLKESLFTLLEKKPIDKITVKELTETADVNRSTFYYYYKDVDDMIINIQNEVFKSFEEEVFSSSANLETVDGLIEYSCRFFTFCKNNVEICRFVLNNDPKNTLSKKIRQTIFKNTTDTKKLFASDDPRRYLTTFAVSAVWSVIVDWMYDGMSVSPREMAIFVSNAYFYGGRTVKGKDRLRGDLKLMD